MRRLERLLERNLELFESSDRARRERVSSSNKDQPSYTPRPNVSAESAERYKLHCIALAWLRHRRQHQSSRIRPDAHHPAPSFSFPLRVLFLSLGPGPVDMAGYPGNNDQVCAYQGGLSTDAEPVREQSTRAPPRSTVNLKLPSGNTRPVSTLAEYLGFASYAFG